MLPLLNEIPITGTYKSIFCCNKFLIRSRRFYSKFHVMIENINLVFQYVYESNPTDDLVHIWNS